MTELGVGFKDEPTSLSPPSCPECTSQKIWKDGLRRTRLGDVQRWLCKKCGFRFSKSGLSSSEGVQKVHRQILNCDQTSPYNRQVGEFLTEDSKNLATVETRIQEKAAGATEADLATIKGDIINFLIYLKNQQYPENTIKVYGRILENLLRKGVDLLNSEAVKHSIANEETSTNTKASKLCAYARFMRWKQIPWEQPRMSREEKDPFLPQISEVDQAISASGWKLRAFLQLIWECALRGIEANELLWEELDQVSRTVRIRPRKRGNPRTLRISEKCLRMLMALPRNSPKVFGNSTLTSKRTSFELTRKRLVRQLGNPRLEQIHFHTLRHLRATIWYRSGVDLKTLQERLGHKNITHTFRYIHIAEALFPEMPDEYFTRVTATLKEGELLVQQGFEFVGKDESGCLWRKKKTYEDVVKEREISENS